MKTQILDGQYIVGVFQDFESLPWKNDPSKFNHRLAISRNFEDRFGNIQNSYVFVNVAQDDVMRLNELKNKLKGKRVMAQVIFDMKSDLQRQKPYAFMDIRLPKGMDVVEVDAPTPETMKRDS